MPSIPLHITRTPSSAITQNCASNPLPSLLHTPSGLALLELQGTIHFPGAPTSTSSTAPADPSTQLNPSTLVGSLVFPLWDPDKGAGDKSWMKRVYLYVGENQRLTGECRALGKPVGVVRRRVGGMDKDVVMGGVERDEGRGGVEGGDVEELEIVDVVRYKIVFSSRPEPVGGEV